jgi:2-polyprenyl-3-methyl-5-hydroxy-6-metoxy-1,4-benzoquinol methylase
MNVQHALSASRDAAADAARLFAEARALQQRGDVDRAIVAYKKCLRADPDHAEAFNDLGCVLLMKGQRREASAAFASSLRLTPELLANFPAVCTTLASVLPEFSKAADVAMSAWPKRPRLKQLFERGGLASIAADPLLLAILRSGAVRDVAFERILTAIRAGLLEKAVNGDKAEPALLAFCGALAEQCFINEYIFAAEPSEEEQLEQLTKAVGAGVAQRSLLPFQLAVLAAFRPLHTLPEAQAISQMKWPDAVKALVQQQIADVAEERRLRGTIPALTKIAAGVSDAVRQQYEDNPYPRWVRLGQAREPLPLSDYLASTLLGEVPAVQAPEQVDILVAGCGTGVHPIELARKLRGARVLALDLSLSSLTYAKRKTPAEIVPRIDYAQADILELNAIDRTFDLIDSRGVLHHMAAPEEGLRVLAGRLRPGGFMHLGFYSEAARRDIHRARERIAAQGLKPTLEDIRRAREMILNSELRTVARSNDFYTTSECRDLLFHVQEHETTLPQIAAMLARVGLRFLGFTFDPASAQHYAAAFAQAGKSGSDLDAWHAFETAYPATFVGMYQFWAQKPL